MIECLVDTPGDDSQNSEQYIPVQIPNATDCNGCEGLCMLIVRLPKDNPERAWLAVQAVKESPTLLDAFKALQANPEVVTSTKLDAIATGKCSLFLTSFSSWH